MYLVLLEVDRKCISLEEAPSWGAAVSGPLASSVQVAKTLATGCQVQDQGIDRSKASRRLPACSALPRDIRHMSTYSVVRTALRSWVPSSTHLRDLCTWGPWTVSCLVRSPRLQLWASCILSSTSGRSWPHCAPGRGHGHTVSSYQEEHGAAVTMGFVVEVEGTVLVLEL